MASTKVPPHARAGPVGRGHRFAADPRCWTDCSVGVGGSVSDSSRDRMLPLVIALCCSGCFFESPLDADAKVPVDAAILGTWRCLGFDEGSDSKPVNFVVSRAGDRRYSIVMKQDGDDADQLDAYASLVKGQTVLNVRIRDVKFPLKPWAVARYSFLRANVVHVQLVDEDKLKEASSSPESFRRAFEAVADQADLYGDLCVCVSVKD